MRQRWSRLRAAPEGGFSLVEMLAALIVFALIAMAVSTSFIRGIDLGRTNRERVAAANLAAADLDLARDTDVTALAGSQALTKRTETVDGRTYYVSRQVQWVSKNATGGPCDGGSGSRLAYLRVDANVTWDRMSGVKPVTSSTIIYPKVGSFDLNTGNAGIKVTDHTAAPVSNRHVTLTGVSGTAGTYSQVTASDGCAFFGYLPAGTYTATLSDAGYVDMKGSSTPTVTLAVQVGQTAAYAFDYDAAATLRVAFKPYDAAHPAPTGLRLRLGNPNGVFTNGVLPTVYGPSAGSSIDVGSLYPFDNGYTVWAGSCTDADPGVANRGSAAVVTSGQLTTAEAPLGAVDIVTKTAANLPKGVQLYAVHANDVTTNGCATGEVIPLGASNTGTGLAQFGLPYGTWKISTSTTGASPFQTVTLTKAAPTASTNLVVP